LHHRKRGPRGLTRAITILVLLVAACLPLFSSAASSAVVEEQRKIVFEYETGKAMVEFEKKVLKALKVYGHVTDPFYRFHFPGKMILEYEENNVYPGGEVPLTIKYRPVDGPGYEFEDKNGIRFGVDFTVFDWEFSVGRNFEEDFPPPMYGDYLEFYDAMWEFWGKYIRCIGGFNISLFAWEDLQGHDVLNMTLHIIEPSGGYLVYFEEKEENPPSERAYYQMFQQWPSGTFNQATLVIAPAYVGKIRLRATMQYFNVTQKSGALSPGIEVNYVKDWFCNHKYIYNTYDWYEIKDKLRGVELDSTETEPLEWELESHPSHLVQNLIAMIQRKTADSPPVIGEPDTLVTKIYNMHSDRCREYDQISLAYYLDDGNGPVPIGNQTLNSSSQQLIDFNAETIDTIEVEFSYDDSSPYWILTKDHQWTYDDPNPRYICAMNADTSTTGGSCDNWVVNPEQLSFSTDKIIKSSPGNNVSIAPFELPLPDFSVDSIGMQSPPYFQPYRAGIHDPDTANFDVTVTNRGTSWPPASVTPDDPEYFVYLTGRAVYESFVPPDSYVAAYNDTFDYRLITPMDRDSTREYSFEYVIPSNIDDLATLAIHRICFVFETNGGGIATNSTVWERNFNDNAFETYHFYTVYPDSALPSDQLAENLENITVAMPDMSVNPPCHMPLYLYVADDELIFSPPDTAPSNLTVEIGVGDWESPPNDPSWSWTPCAYIWDHVDGNFTSWKVYEGDLCSFVLGESGSYSYCSRASLNSTSTRPTYLYIDSDGASSVDGVDNHYYYDMAGSVSLYSPAPGWKYSHKDLFQDNFPVDEFNMESWVRADMAYDINGPYTEIRPGDSVVVCCVPPDEGTIDTTEAGEPKVYMNIRVTDTWPGRPGGAKPPLAGAQLQGTYGNYVSDDGTWTVIMGEPAVGSDGSMALDYYMFDLNDSLFTRGYMIEYYFKYFYNDGMSSILPAYAETGGNCFEFTCLPTGRSDILFVDDFDGRGSFRGVVQDYWDATFEAVIGLEYQPDVYDVNSPSSMVGNGLESRAELNHLMYNEVGLSGYRAIIWDSGDLDQGTIGDGSGGSDKADDCTLLYNWLDWSPNDAVLIVCGDGVAHDLSQNLVSPQALMLMSSMCGVGYVADSYFEMTGGWDGGGILNPPVTGAEGSCFWHSGAPNQLSLAGTYPLFMDFDVLSTASFGIEALLYPDYESTSYFAGIQSAQQNSAEYTARTMWLGFSWMSIRDDELGAPIDRNQLFSDIMWCFGMGMPGPDITSAEGAVPRYGLSQNYPNPFNPVTTIRFEIERKGRVRLRIYNVAGQLVRTLVDDVLDAGSYDKDWKGLNNAGKKVASGVYFYRLEVGEYESVKKMVLLR
jgi:hypothetical protein